MRTMSFLAVMMALVLSRCPAQEMVSSVLSAGGGSAASTRISLSWTIGESAVSSYELPSGALLEGFQQPIIMAVHGRVAGLPFSLKIYPNPTQHSVFAVLHGASEDMTLVLHNLLGEVVRRIAVRGDDQLVRIPMQTLPNGVYLLAVHTDSGMRESLYKIIKAE